MSQLTRQALSPRDSRGGEEVARRADVLAEGRSVVSSAVPRYALTRTTSPGFAERIVSTAAPISGERSWSLVPLCPDFVVELRSPSDPLPTIEAKMREYLENGARLGWLLDPQERKAYVYVPGEPVWVLNHPDTLSGEPTLASSC
ncbi:MAG: Uma2 family endonuclease [Rubrobacteraceae bacterium]